MSDLTIFQRIRGAIKKALPDAIVMLIYKIRYFLRTGHSFKSGTYWEERYAGGDTSGSGSYGKLAKFKADFLNDFTTKKQIESVIEFGSGDGNQASLFEFKKYIGFDVSANAIAKCQERFREDTTKQFLPLQQYNGEQADLTVSLDVIYHLVENEVYEDYMKRLFSAATRYVIVYSSNDETLNSTQPHIRHRKFTDWVAINASEWELKEIVKNIYPYQKDNPDETSCADFYIFQKAN